ncbi:MAG: DUF503 domain-containing protein [Acidobacteria bacterium]|nr:DUF503 domain-containing protein [Acidobacteriota bacterium]
MPIGLLTLEIHIPEAHSLKEKRFVVRKIKDRLRSRFNVAVAELDHQDLWQRALLGVVSISSDRQTLETFLDSVERESAKVLGGDLIHTERELF